MKDLIILLTDGNALDLIALIVSIIALGISIYQARIGKKSYNRENSEFIHISYSFLADAIEINFINKGKLPVTLNKLSILYGMDAHNAQAVFIQKLEGAKGELTGFSKELVWRVPLSALRQSARDLQILPNKNRLLFIETRSNLDSVFNCLIEFKKEYIPENFGEELIQQYNCVDFVMGFERQQHFMSPGYGAHFKIK